MIGDRGSAWCSLGWAGGDLWWGGEGVGVGDRRGDDGTSIGVGVGDWCSDGGSLAGGGEDGGRTSGTVGGSTNATGSSTPPDGITGETLGLVVLGTTGAGALQEEVVKSKKS